MPRYFNIFKFIYVFGKKFVLGGTESDYQVGAVVTLSPVT